MFDTLPFSRRIEAIAMNDASTTVRGTALLTKALDIVEMISDSDNRMQFKDIAERTGHSKSTLYRILSALTARGMIDIDRRDQSYVLGPKFTRLAGSINSSSDLIAVAAGSLKAIADLHGENINLAILSGTAHVTISRWQGRLTQGFSSPLGERKPLHATGLGKSLIAFLPEPERQRLLGQIRMQAYTPHTITDAATLTRDLELCRARGFALDDNEIIDGVTCVAVPVMDPDGAVIAAVSITAPSHRMGERRRLELAAALQAATRQITAQLTLPRRSATETVASTRARVAVTDLRGFSPRMAGWSEAFGGLVWFDGPAGMLMLQHGAEQRVLAQFGQIRAVAVRADGGLTALADGGLWSIAPEATKPEPLAPSSAIDAADLAALPDGDLLVLQAGTLRRLSADLREKWALATGLADECGLDLLGKQVHVATADGRQVLSIDLQGEVVSTRALPPEVAAGSGLVADGRGGFWLAGRLNWELCHIDHAGLVTRLPLPVPGAQGLARGQGAGEVYAGSDRISLSQSTLEIAPMAGALVHAALPS